MSSGTKPMPAAMTETEGTVKRNERIYPEGYVPKAIERIREIEASGVLDEMKLGHVMGKLLDTLEGMEGYEKRENAEVVFEEGEGKYRICWDSGDEVKIVYFEEVTIPEDNPIRISLKIKPGEMTLVASGDATTVILEDLANFENVPTPSGASQDVPTSELGRAIFYNEEKKDQNTADVLFKSHAQRIMHIKNVSGRLVLSGEIKVTMQDAWGEREAEDMTIVTQTINIHSGPLGENTTKESVVDKSII